MIQWMIILYLLFCFYKITPTKETMMCMHPFLKSHFTVESASVNHCKVSAGDRSFVFPSIVFNDLHVHFLLKNKIETNRILALYGIPVPLHQLIFLTEKNIPLMIPFPIVLKPIDGMQGEDVITDISCMQHYTKICSELNKKYKTIMAEEQVRGNVYRFFLFNHQVLHVILRETPFVVGDGIHTVGQLIQSRNDDLVKQNMFPTTKNIMCPSLDLVLEKNQTMEITHTLNFHNGSIPYAISLDQISPDLLKMMRFISHVLHIMCCGIDFIGDHKKGKGSVLEINGDPDTWIHIKSEINCPLYMNIKKEMDDLLMTVPMGYDRADRSIRDPPINSGNATF